VCERRPRAEHSRDSQRRAVHTCLTQVDLLSHRFESATACESDFSWVSYARLKNRSPARTPAWILGRLPADHCQHSRIVERQDDPHEHDQRCATTHVCRNGRALDTNPILRGPGRFYTTQAFCGGNAVVDRRVRVRRRENFPVITSAVRMFARRPSLPACSRTDLNLSRLCRASRFHCKFQP